MSFQSVGFLAFLAGTVLICLTAERRHPQAGRLLLMLACAGAAAEGALMISEAQSNNDTDWALHFCDYI